MKTASRPLLLSLRPRFAQAILDGSKSAELRRRRVSAEPGTAVILYASSPLMAVVGTARVEKVRVLTPRGAWPHHGPNTALTRQEYYDYLDGSDIACLIYLHHIQRLPVVLPLGELRSTHRFHPPQSYRFITHDDPKTLQQLAAAVGPT
ncbi:ASCH domain-containing protein [Catellatospora sichuanensis]|uniref:ASCH domain-containing protein n=1 Tax=Catellatospora sichuanensis TaxID=1969805 RepID=UPI001182695A|nr:ASCH domain-containing protein [Catellatospora sichuanensis]